jgi:hypothetical protein
VEMGLVFGDSKALRLVASVFSIMGGVYHTVFMRTG